MMIIFASGFVAFMEKKIRRFLEVIILPFTVMSALYLRAKTLKLSDNLMLYQQESLICHGTPMSWYIVKPLKRMS